MHDNCEKCKFRKKLMNIPNEEHTFIQLCWAAPNKDQDGTTTWLDIEDFDAEDCMDFQEA